ncbi:MAG: cytosine permease [Firmicutes bacterium]|nr:cytosine permease [Bacillota bacterium]
MIEWRSDASRQLQNDDFPLTVVPSSHLLPWWQLAWMRWGQFTTLAQLTMGATLGWSMGLFQALLALSLGTLILLMVAIPMGIMGQQTRLATALAARQTGLGQFGSGVVSFVAGLSVMGWFGVQNGLFAEGLHALTGWGTPLLWTVGSGLGLTALVYGGILAMGWLAYVTVPLFLGLLVWTSLRLPHLHPINWHAAPGPHSLSLTAAVTIVVGSFITGAVLSPDMTRFHWNTRDVIKQTVWSFALGNLVIGGLGAWLAQAARTPNVAHVLASTVVGIGGTLLFVTSTIKVNDWDIYGASLAFVNGLDLLGKHRVTRQKMTLIVGTLGTLLGLLGIVHVFESFLLVLGVAIPPFAAIMILDYGIRPHKLVNRFNFSSLIALTSWVAGFTAGLWIPWGIGAINSLVITAVLYTVLKKMSRTIWGP